MLESVSSINTDGKILFIEDVGENIYHIHRMLVALDRAGKLKNLKGLIVGGMTKIKVDDYFYDTSLEAVIMEVCGKYDYPVCFDFPAGHGGKNYALRLGCPATLTITPKRCTLVFE
jgi:muramoyltetrapeptide carboxypeptidase